MATEQSVMAVIRASRPTFRNSHDKVAFAVHASFLASGFVLHATGPSASTDDALYSTSTDEVGSEHWNEMEGNYAFVYSKPDKSSKKVLVKCLVMNNKLLVDTLRDGDKVPLHLEISVHDYIGENGGTNYNSQFKNLGKLVGELNKQILSKYSGSSTGNPSTQTSRTEEGGLRDQPTAEPVYQPANSFPLGYVVPPVPGVGGSDLFPGPGAGVYPTRGEVGGGGSMLVGPNDPRFFGGIGGEPLLPGGLPGVPPGARFDPYGPPDVPGFEPSRFIRDPRRRGNGRNHPDLEHFGGGSDFI